MFADLDADEVLSATHEWWDVSGPVPVPKGDWLACPVCGSKAVQARYFKFHARPPEATLRFRCDVSVKCCCCAMVWIHGVALDADTWARCTKRQRPRRQIPWREARELLDREQKE